MTSRRDHGHTPAAWATVLIVLVGIFLGAFAVAVTNWPLFWASVGVVVVGGVVGKVMQMMGLGKAQPEVAEAAVLAPERDG